ncbi:putative cobalt ABC transporter ATP binding protein [Methanocella paludicola SANAE]|uniref:Cobalt ABC transporter ATP binding protein n=1 Tax=Methanocella paludicola (strain DSM 17711 / JCM 13418 / NBRC 101707 / SANAE) TaxID=304371 RepID=D1YVI0_METPS|nr:ATP-binding cassette domain-containing protein [Methanocella paludicola]BAI60452.1 putative cobalt ABC transporter ATP binding protein [Methanocella paludicola SANAE]
MISLRDVSFSYGCLSALDHISLQVEKGEHMALIGPNASGKTTLAMVMNALLTPDRGECLVEGIDTRDDPMFARRTVGMVFQDPESQTVARRVWDDVAFGPMNLGLPDGEVEKRVRESLDHVGLGAFSRREVSCLSGGQKQLLAVAGILAMKPSYIVFDEPTALLDGPGCRMVNKAVAGLKKNGIGIITITHDMEEALTADRIVALDTGRIVADMPPASLFSDEALMARIGIKPPYTFNLAVPREVVRECR